MIIRVVHLKSQAARLRAARAIENRLIILAFGVRPVIQSKQEARLARSEQLKSILHSEVVATAHSASVALRHLQVCGKLFRSEEKTSEK